MSLFPSEDLSIALSVPAEEFLARLEPQVLGSVLQRPFGDKLVGKVSAAGIRIRRSRTFMKNDLSPEFSGQVTPDERFLRGSFQIRAYALPALGVAMLAMIATSALFSVRAMGMAGALPYLLASVVGAGALGMLLVQLGWSFGRSDIDRITAVLRAAAQGR